MIWRQLSHLTQSPSVLTRCSSSEGAPGCRAGCCRVNQAKLLLVFYASLREDTLVEGMLDLLDLADQIGRLHQFRIRIPARADHMKLSGARGQALQDLVDSQHPVMDGVIDLVEDQH